MQLKFLSSPTQIPTLIAGAALFSLPLVRLDTLLDPHYLPQLFILSVSVIALLVLYSLTFMRAKQLPLTISPLHISFLAFNLTILISLLTQSPNRFEAFLTDLLPLLLTSLSLVLFTQLHPLSLPFISRVLVVISSIYTLASIITYIIGGTTSPLPPFLSSSTPTQFTFIVLGLICLAHPLLQSFHTLQKQTKWIKYLPNILLIVLNATGFTFILPKLPTLTRNSSTSWTVMLESLKRSPLLGLGPGNYPQAYTTYQPDIDHTIVPPTYASNTIFHYTTTSGLASLASLLALLVIATLTIARSFRSHPLPNLLAATTLLAFAIRPDLIHLYLLAVFLSPPHLHQPSLKMQSSLHPRLHALLLIATFAPVIALMYLLYITLTADLAAKSATTSYANGRILDAHLAFTRAVDTNPHIDTYHVSLANTSITIAEELAKKKDLTDQEKTQVTQLIEQSIAQAKLATRLNPLKSANWYALAGIYTRLIPVSGDAATWAQGSLLKAVTLKPLDYSLHFELASLYYNTGHLSEAENQFKSAITLNPSHTNSYYNLAHVYLTQKRPDLALPLLRKTLTLLSPNSRDWEAVSKEIDTLRPQPTTKDSTLSRPENIPTKTPLILNQSNAPDL